MGSVRGSPWTFASGDSELSRYCAAGRNSHGPAAPTALDIDAVQRFNRAGAEQGAVSFARRLLGRRRVDEIDHFRTSWAHATWSGEHMCPCFE